MDYCDIFVKFIINSGCLFDTWKLLRAFRHRSVSYTAATTQIRTIILRMGVFCKKLVKKGLLLTLMFCSLEFAIIQELKASLSSLFALTTLRATGM